MQTNFDDEFLRAFMILRMVKDPGSRIVAMRMPPSRPSRRPILPLVYRHSHLEVLDKFLLVLNPLLPASKHRSG